MYMDVFYANVYIYVNVYVYTSHTWTYIYISLTGRRSVGSSLLEKGENSFKIISILLLWKLKNKRERNEIFRFEMHNKIKHYNAHRFFFQGYIINNTGKHITNQ